MFPFSASSQEITARWLFVHSQTACGISECESTALEDRMAQCIENTELTNSLDVISIASEVESITGELETLVATFALSGDCLSDTPFFITPLDHFEQIIDSLGDFEMSDFEDSDIALLAERFSTSVLRLNLPFALQTLSIPKPWGQEIWYTGVEERGVCRVKNAGQQHDVPLPWLLSLFPSAFSAGQGQLVLLKILDPRPEPVYGDLYFELHEEKREVYVVTHVDDNAWPSGEGGIRFGFCPKKRSEYQSDADFLADYEQAVQDYRKVRVEIDELYDEQRQAQGYGLNEPLSYEVIAPWEAQLPSDLRQKEQQLRTAMDAFTHLKPLKVGDAVKVPCFLPHSLQHGVRTIEFQTPVYERKILSFAQKVLTQDHWDTADALKLASVASAQDSDLAVLSETDSLKQESVVEFDDFSVKRLTLSANSQIELPNLSYTLVIGIEQTIQCDGSKVQPEQAVMIPSCKDAFLVENRSDSQAVFLIASPVV